MRVALITDLHGNEISLDAVLADIEQRGVDQVVCLGDTATLGPRPGQVLARLRDLGCPCIMGNHDEFLLEPDLINRYTETAIVRDSVDWCRDQLAAEELELVSTFVSELELESDDGTQMLLFHGSPRSNMEDILATTPDDQLDELLGGRRATVMAGGHTHRQMLRRHRGMFLVNPGSLGLPFEGIGPEGPIIGEGAEYAIVELVGTRVSVDLRRVTIDKADLRRQLQGSDLPLATSLRQAYA